MSSARERGRGLLATMPGLSGFAWTGLALVVLTVSLGLAGMPARLPVVYGLLVAVTACNLVWDHVLPDRDPGTVDRIAGLVGALATALSLALAAALYVRGLGPFEYWSGCALAVVAALPLVADALSTVAAKARGRA